MSARTPCWSCHEAVDGPVCVGCGAIQPLRPDTSLFDALGLPRRYSLDRKDVMRAWRAASRKVHPDRFAGRPAVQRRMSLQWTATVNEAKRVLTDDLLRAGYLATGRTQPREEGGPQLDADFLEAVFDLQMEARSDPSGVRERAESLRSGLRGSLDAVFAAWEAGEGTLDTVEPLLAQLRYIDKAVDRAS